MTSPGRDIMIYCLSCDNIYPKDFCIDKNSTMKKSIVLSIALCAALSANAEYTGAGYYRVQNLKTTRWASVIDDYGRIDYGSTSADLVAIKLQKNVDAVMCDPASILYISPIAHKFQMEAQNTGIHQIIGHYADLTENGAVNGEKVYLASGTSSGMTKYLGDGQFMLTRDLGRMGTTSSGDFRRWYIKPVDAEGDNYFGVLPTVESEGKYFTSMYCSFPITPYSKDVKVYYVAGVHKDMAYLEEVKGTVPAGTPVIIECASMDPSDNRMTVGGNGSALSGNKMTGVYFNHNDVDKLSPHYKCVPYDPATMRVLARLDDGKLGFVTATDLDFIPANTAYIKVKPDAPATLRRVTYDEYLADVHGVEAEEESTRDVYNLQGVLLYKNATDEQINALPHGCYIIAGKKILIQ